MFDGRRREYKEGGVDNVSLCVWRVVDGGVMRKVEWVELFLLVWELEVLVSWKCW